MLIRKATAEQIQHALDEANKHFDGNLCFKRFDPAGKHYRVTITVRDSQGPGTRFGISSLMFGRKPRRVRAACWHAHGHFFDALPKGTEILVGSRARESGEHVTHPGDEWQDHNIGSPMYPVMFSDACVCRYGERMLEAVGADRMPAGEPMGSPSRD